MQPSAITGVPVMSPAPPAATVENVQAVASVGASAGEITFSLGWLRVLARSWPYARHSPPGTPSGAHAEAVPVHPAPTASVAIPVNNALKATRDRPSST